MISLFISLAGFSQNEKLFEEANALYNEDKFVEAIAKYEAILETDEHSAAIYYNLGNAHYKLSNIGPSIYYYEKALILSPNDSDIKNNLAFAQNMTIDAIEPLPKTGLTKLLDGLIGKLSYEAWGMVAIAGIAIFIVLFLSYYFSKATAAKRTAFVVSLACLGLSVLALTFAFRQQRVHQNNDPAIVFAEKASIRSGPKLSDEEVFVLHEGTKVQVLDEFDNWNKIRIADGKTGWLPSSEIKKLKAF